MQDLWVFGYGSLMWKPGFVFRASYPARLYGFHRSLCVYSFVHRGTPEHPGLVMGLDRGGSCQGIAFHVDGARRDEVLAYLRSREQATMVYRERHQTVHLGAARTVEAMTYCVDRSHPQYAGSLSRDAQLSIVQDARGQSGRNPEYVVETVAALERLGVHDPTLYWLATRLQAGK